MKQAPTQTSMFRKFQSGISATVILTAMLVGCILDSSTNVAPPPAPSITLQPINQSVTWSAAALFIVKAQGQKPFTYKWVKNNTDTVSGSTGDSLTVSNVQDANNGWTYKCVVRNSAGQTVSNPATLTVLNPGIVSQDTATKNLLAGSLVKFAVKAAGSSALHYKWVRNNTDTVPDSVTIYEGYSVPTSILGDSIPGAGYTEDTLILDSASAANAGSYKCVVRNSHGTVVTKPDTLKVKSLSPATLVLYEKGEIRFNSICSGCHQPDGKGAPGSIPPFNPSDFLMADRHRPIRLEMLGLPNFTDSAATIVVNGDSFESSMPGIGGTDSEIAGVLTYLRDHFNGATDSISVQEVGHIRDSLLAACATHLNDPNFQWNCYVDTTHN